MKEIRLYPYLFPDTFNHEGGDPEGEARKVWRMTRRAALRCPIDRIGYGGYLSLAVQFPGFVQAATDIFDEFRGLKHHSQMTKPYAHPVKVAVLNAWGKLRSWYPAFDAGGFGGGMPESNLFECLSGLPVDLQFIGFDDVRDGKLGEFDVLINDGDAGLSWSGGDNWKDPDVVAEIRRFVHGGGGFIGVRQPSATEHQGRFFQLADVLGVDEETGRSLLFLKPEGDVLENHFILGSDGAAFDPGFNISRVYPTGSKTQVLQKSPEGSHVLLAANSYGQGRSVYFSRLPFSMDNARVLLKAILWSAGREDLLQVWSSSHPNVDVAAYPEAGTFAVANSSDEPVKATVYGGNGDAFEVNLDANAMKWFS